MHNFAPSTTSREASISLNARKRDNLSQTHAGRQIAAGKSQTESTCQVNSPHGCLKLLTAISTGLARRIIEYVANRNDIHLPPLPFMGGINTHRSSIAAGAGVNINSMDRPDLR